MYICIQRYLSLFFRQLVGITSWGHNVGCGFAGKYGVYTYVRKTQDWIKQVTTYTQFYRPLHYIASY